MIWTVFIKILKNTIPKNQTILIVFDDTNADIFSNKKLNPIGTESFIRGRKLNISPVFITQSYFSVPKNIRRNSTHYLLWKFQTKENFIKLHLIIHPILTFKTLLIFIKSALQTHILFRLLILLFRLIIIYVLERIL